MKYTDEFLISELHRFVRENGRSPVDLDMQGKFGYLFAGAYARHFGSFNNALEVAGLKINRIRYELDGTETCSYCGKRADEILNFKQWLYPNDIRYCYKHGQNSDYVKGQLNINSPPGRGRAGEIAVVKALKIGNEHDCALISMGHSFDLYHDEYGKINVKTSVLKNNKWTFGFRAEKIANTYICLGMSSDTKNILCVWIVPNEDKIRYLTGLGVYNTYGSLKTHKKWEVDSELYDESWKEMLVNYTNGNCKVFGKKDKEECSQERQERYEQFKKEFHEKHKKE